MTKTVKSMTFAIALFTLLNVPHFAHSMTKKELQTERVKLLVELDNFSQFIDLQFAPMQAASDAYNTIYLNKDVAACRAQNKNLARLGRIADKLLAANSLKIEDFQQRAQELKSRKLIDYVGAIYISNANKFYLFRFFNLQPRDCNF